MSLNSLEEIASYIVSDGKGILAADESNPTCGKRFDSTPIESNLLPQVGLLSSAARIPFPSDTI